MQKNSLMPISPLHLFRTKAIATVAVLCLPAVAQIAEAPTSALPPQPIKITDPGASFVFKNTAIGSSDSQYFSVFNISTAPVQLGQVYLDGGGIALCAALGCGLIDPKSYSIGLNTSDGCSGTTLQPGKGCSVLVSFIPQGVGYRKANLAFPRVGSGVIVNAIISGKGTTEPLDCVLDWVEKKFPTELPPSFAGTFQLDVFYARCYASNICIGADVAYPTFAPASIYLYQNQQLQALGKLSDFASMAQCPLPSVQPLSTPAQK